MTEGDTMAKDDRDRHDRDGGRHENEDEKRRERNGQPAGPIDPDTIREPPPGKRGR